MGLVAGDVFVVFGITGDLAKEMTFRSLYRLERRGLLGCPIVGVAVDDWTAAELRRHLRSAIRAGGEKVERPVFDRLAARFDYVQGDFTDPATYERVAAAIKGATCPVFYLETPPSLFGRVVAGLAQAGLTKNARVVIEKPFGHDLASARALAAELHRSVPEEQLFRVDHFLGKLGLEELLYLRFANTMLEPVWNRHHVACVQVTLAERPLSRVLSSTPAGRPIAGPVSTPSPTPQPSIPESSPTPTPTPWRRSWTAARWRSGPATTAPSP